MMDGNKGSRGVAFFKKGRQSRKLLKNPCQKFPFSRGLF
ncbi:hypothetical protein SXCC_02236 [Gluconacetobacter sp. SXCC-1]|nr:hypothetical protein SXCC_02236 [Gluconacetobacter sp. SXCC-1]